MIDYDFKPSDDVNEGFRSLYQIVTYLRDPEDGCPWDREQMPKDIIRSLQGEIYEYLDALSEGDTNHQCEELGDLFLNLFLLTKIHDQNGDFKASDSLNGACEKYVRRHPHVFSNVEVSGTDDVLRNWNQIKKDVEGRKETSVFGSDIEKSAPELERCYKMSKKAAKMGFDWNDKNGAYDKVREELSEAQCAESENLEEELGDVLFSMVQVCRMNHIKPTDALQHANHKFASRCNAMLRLCEERNLVFEKLSADEKDILWREVKKNIH